MEEAGMRISKHGDLLEKYYSKYLFNRLPNYATFWEAFIGNDGSSQPLPMDRASPSANKTREKLWPLLYTMFESMALCWRIEDKLQKLSRIHSPESYADNLNDWMAFFAHTGRVHDMAKKSAQEVGDSDDEGLFEPFKSFYQKRHGIVHYPKIPISKVDGWLKTRAISDNLSLMKNGSVWTDGKETDFQFTIDTVEHLLRDYEQVVNTFFGKLNSIAREKCGFKEVDWSTVSHIPTETTAAFPVSEALDTLPLSAPPSGSVDFNEPDS